MFRESRLRGKRMLRNWCLSAAIALSAGAAQAQTDCGQSYVLKDGDTLLSVAQEYYGERSKWSVIYYANEEGLGGNLVDLPVGVKLNIPCLEDKPVKREPDPIFDILVLLYVRTDGGFAFEKDEDLFGKTVCREKGYFTHDLDSSERRWLTKGLVKLVRGDTTDDCFQMVVDGKVDAVSVNEFLGAEKIKALKLEGKIQGLSRPVGSQGLHVVISKRHWRGTTNLYRFNAGLEKLKKTARYDEIVSRHLDLFWERNQ